MQTSKKRGREGLTRELENVDRQEDGWGGVQEGRGGNLDKEGERQCKVL